MDAKPRDNCISSCFTQGLPGIPEARTAAVSDEKKLRVNISA